MMYLARMLTAAKADLGKMSEWSNEAFSYYFVLLELAHHIVKELDEEKLSSERLLNECED